MFAVSTNPWRLAFAAGAVILISFAPTADARSYPEYVKTACKKDFKSFCPRYDIESNALRQCMRSAQEALSPRCVEALQKSGERRRK